MATVSVLLVLPAINAVSNAQKGLFARSTRETYRCSFQRNTFLLHLSVPNFYTGEETEDESRPSRPFLNLQVTNKLKRDFIRNVVEGGRVLFDTDFKQFS